MVWTYRTRTYRIKTCRFCGKNSRLYTFSRTTSKTNNFQFQNINLNGSTCVVHKNFIFTIVFYGLMINLLTQKVKHLSYQNKKNEQKRREKQTGFINQIIYAVIVGQPKLKPCRLTPMCRQKCRFTSKNKTVVYYYRLNNCYTERN